MKVQEGKFKLQDLLVVPMQRVLKYHLLLKARACSTHLNPPPLQLSSSRYRKTGPLLLFPVQVFQSQQQGLRERAFQTG